VQVLISARLNFKNKYLPHVGSMGCICHIL